VEPQKQAVIPCGWRAFCAVLVGLVCAFPIAAPTKSKVHGAPEQQVTIRGQFRVEGLPAVDLDGLEVEAVDRDAARPWRSSVVSDVGGRFVFSNVPPESTTIELSFGAGIAGYCDVRPLYVRPGAQDVLVELQRAGAIHGSVRAAGSTAQPPAVELSVEASWTSRWVGDIGTVSSPIGADGTFILDGVPLLGDIHVCVRPKGLQGPRAYSKPVVAHAGDAKVQLVLEGGATLKGVFVSQDGSVPSGPFALVLYPDFKGGKVLRLPIAVFTLERGASFEIAGLPSYPLLVKVLTVNKDRASGESPRCLALVNDVVAGDELLKIQLGSERRELIQVQVDAHAMEPLEISAWHDGMPILTVEDARCDAKGAWRGVLEVPNGVRDYTLVATDSVGNIGVAHFRTGGDVRLVMKLSPPACVTGRIHRTHPEPAVAVVTCGELALATSSVHIDGFFKICGAPQGPVEVWALGRSRPPAPLCSMAAWSSFDTRSDRVVSSGGATSVDVHLTYSK